MLRTLFLRVLAVLLVSSAAAAPTVAAENETLNHAPQTRYWIDTDASATVEQVAALPATEWQAVQQTTFKLPDGALWLHLLLPPEPNQKDRYLLLDSSAFTNRASLYQLRGTEWVGQHAGDHIPVAQWPMPDRSPVFALDPSEGPQALLLRLENRPAPLSVQLSVVGHDELQRGRSWTLLLVGGYLGFGLLVMFLGWVHARLYRDRAFVAYVGYVASMLGFQAAFTGIGGLFFWPHWAWFNNAAPALFMLWLTGTGIWFVREVCAIARHHPGLDRFVIGWSVFGLLYPVIYLSMESPAALGVLNLYGLLSVLMSIGLCLWAWRKGERYAGWMVLGFAPVHLAYPFPALRAAGLMADSWGAQYAVLIGSAIEIPLLLYILHHRARHFSENRARLRALDQSDPLTGLTVSLVLMLRLCDAIRRARRYGHHCHLLMVELANHADLRLRMDRETADRALVVAAGRLSRVVRDVDTVCRVTENRFVILVEGPADADQIRVLAQHIVAKGLEPGSLLPEDTSLRFRVASLALPEERPPAGEEEERVEARRALARLHLALDQTDEPSRRPVLHLSLQAAN
ncbi:MAG: diguanylate cyclase [Hydrogenophaga sp.]|nr:diguanylate cyclase [Hydrogenophaga sp.]